MWHKVGRKQLGWETTSKPPAQTLNLMHRRTDGTFSSANLSQTEKCSDWLGRDCGQRQRLCRGWWKVKKKNKKKSAVVFHVNARAHSNLLCCFHESSPQPNNSYETQTEPAAGTSRTKPTKRYLDKIEKLQLFSISMVPPCLDLAKSETTNQCSTPQNAPLFSYQCDLNWTIVHQLSERCMYEDFETINSLKTEVNKMVLEHFFPKLT